MVNSTIPTGDIYYQAIVLWHLLIGQLVEETQILVFASIWSKLYGTDKVDLAINIGNVESLHGILAIYFVSLYFHHLQWCPIKSLFLNGFYIYLCICSWVRERLKSKMARIRKVPCSLSDRNDGVLSSMENFYLLIKDHICVIHVGMRRELTVLCCFTNNGYPVLIPTLVCCAEVRIIYREWSVRLEYYLWSIPCTENLVKHTCSWYRA